MNIWDAYDPDEPVGVVTPGGHGWYRVNVRCGISTYSVDWLVFGRKRAERKALRKARKWKQDMERTRQQYEVRP